MATSARKSSASKTSTKRKSAAKKKPTNKRSTKSSDAAEPTEISLDDDASSGVTFSKPAGGSAVSAPSSTLVRGVRERDITAFLRQLIMLLESGTPMLKSLNTIANRGDRQAVRSLVKDIATQVEHGSPLWQAFSRHPHYFPPVFVNLVKAGEASGTVVPILRRVVTFREKRAMLARRMQSALLYPTVLVVFCFAVIVLLAKFVIPQFIGIFDTFEVQPEGFAVVFLNITLWIGAYWWLPPLVIIGAVLIYKLAVSRNPVMRMWADRVKMRIPVFGPITRRAAIVDFCRTFSILLRSGLSMMATLDLCRNSVSNRALVDAIQDMRDSVERGEGLEKPLRVAERNKVFPPVVVDMLVTGEETGTIDNVAEQIAEQYEEEVEIMVDALGEAIQPMATVFMGLVVGLIVFALFGPLIEMIEKLSAGAGAAS